MNQELQDRIRKAVQQVGGFYWSEIASHFPEIKSGDFPPELAVEFESACEKAVTAWVEINMPG